MIKCTNFFMEESSMISESYAKFAQQPIPETKRYLYHILEEKLSIPRDVDHGDTRRSYTILGPRKVGKTIILRQLEKHFGTTSCYMDMSITDKASDFVKMFSDALNDGVSIILLDEISKIHEDRVAAFVSAVKDFCWCISFVLTGSTKSAVSKLSSMIGRSDMEFELPPILYIERLAWEQNTDVYNLNAYRAGISLDSFKHYVEYFAIKPEESGLVYVRNLVEDTMESIRAQEHIDEDGCSLADLSINMQETLLKYVSLCQLVYKIKGKAYCSIPSLSDYVQKTMGDLYITIRSKQNMSKIAIALMCQLILESGLAVEIYTRYDDIGDVHLQNHRIDKDVPNIAFEYPWYATIAIADVLDTPTMWGFWVENLLYLKMWHVFTFVDKYRANETAEIDNVYTNNFNGFYGLECKFRPRNELSDSLIKKYQDIAKSIDMQRMDIVTTDCSNVFDNFTRFYKVHELVAALELEYVNLRDELHTSLKLEDIMQKYNFS